MTLKEFKTQANKIAAKHGIKIENVHVYASVYGLYARTEAEEQPTYNISCWLTLPRSKRIESLRLPSPSAALKSFEDLLEIEFKEYPQEKENIEL